MDQITLTPANVDKIYIKYGLQRNKLKNKNLAELKKKHLLKVVLFELKTKKGSRYN